MSQGKNIEKAVVTAYKKIETSVVDAYKKVEKSATGAYGKIEDRFVDKFFRKDGETVEEAKNRLNRE